MTMDAGRLEFIRDEIIKVEGALQTEIASLEAQIQEKQQNNRELKEKQELGEEELAVVRQRNEASEREIEEIKRKIEAVERIVAVKV